MGKGRPRAVEKGVLGHVPGGAACSSAASTSSSSAASIPQAPVFYPTEEEFADPLGFIFKIRPQAEPFGICRIVPPRSWNPPFALDRDAFTFPTKSQAIDRLQARAPSCDPETFRLEYGRFLESHLGKRSVRRVVFEAEDLDLCRLFNAVKRFGGYDKVCAGKRWAEVARFVRPTAKISECAKHVLCQLYREHLYDYEEYNCQLDRGSKAQKTAKPCLQRKTSTQCVAPVRKRRKGSRFDKVKEVKQEELDQICEQCNSGLHGEVMLLCDRCDRGWHMYCLSPPLDSIPSGNWYCLDCINSDKDSFGFVPGKLYTVDAFRRIDDRMRRRWFGQTNISRVQIEKRFWEIVEGRAGEVEVMYGSDLDTSLYGSGFPRANDMIPSSIDPHLWKKYASSPWNLNNLPKLPGSMLRAVHENIAGGEPKCWYGVPGNEANAFEQVMRKALPDLFEAQPDLLFQLVTMLNPSILLENGVPVYSVLQEPGNFVITFPRSFHGGFNFGLNCAEAVNFAPADWLPHGGVGAELYRFYRKSSVLSHEELLCVAIKSGYDTKSFPYLKQEMQRVFSREKKYREELWVNGIARSSPMQPKKHPNYVGTEEDATCVICQQYLYLSAVTCSCRPSTYVCLDHWKHLCECKPDKHHLHYRHTLAELGDLVHMVDFESEMTNVAMGLYDRSSAITKKMKDGEISYLQLAEDWLSQSCHILEIPFSNSAYHGALIEAEQFLWADHDMDPVRDMTIKLHEAQKWALDVNSCVHQVESFANSPERQKEKVSLSELERLLSFQPFPCCLPNFSMLKDVVEDAQTLVAKVESALSTSSSVSRKIGTLDILFTQCTEFSISLPITERLSNEISSAKIWLTNAHSCLMEKRPGAINIDFLNKLKSEMLELHVNLPEMDLLLSLCKDVESWKRRCEEILTGSIIMKELEDFLLSADYLTVSIPEIDLLRKYSSDARSWVCHVHNVLQNLNNREDHGNIVIELLNIFKAGELLRVQVDELSLVETELKRSRCRENASKALATVMPLGFLQQVLQEASQLEIESEQLFIDVSKVLGRAISWEGKAKSAMEKGAHISDFEKIVRDSEDILVGLPSLPGIVDTLATAQLWISRSQTHLKSSTNVNPADLLKVDDLKDLISQSKHLKVTVDVTDKLQLILTEVEGWEQQSCSLLEDIKSLFYMHQTGIEVENHLSTMIGKLLRNIDYATEVGQSLCYNFKELPELKAASLSLHWCLNAISFCYGIPSLKDIDKFLGDADHLPGIFSDSHLAQMLIKGVTCLRKALCSLPQLDNSTRRSLKEVDVILDEIKEVIIPYPIMVTQLQNAIQKHKSWVERVHAYFQLPRQQPWSSLLKLKEHGEADAFNCAELDKVASEVVKVENWLSRCRSVLAPILGNDGSLSSKLVQIKGSLNKALGIYRDSEGRQPRGFCVCCPNYSGNEDTYSCLLCDDKYHLSCTGPSVGNAATMNEYACPLCVYIENGTLPRNGNQSLLSRGDRPEVKSFVELVTSAHDLFARFEELYLVEGIVEQARECNFQLTEIVNYTISYNEKDLGSISKKLLSAFKAMAVAGMYDHQDWYIFESALFRYSWKVKVRKLLKGSRKPVLQQIQRVIKEGAAMGIPSEDHFMKEVAEAKQTSIHWADIAKKVATDSGELSLSEVYKLIIEGENLPIHLEKELKALRERSLLYCICRKPNDQRAMIACDKCDEWYHFDCINLNGPPPKTFYCPACRPTDGVFISFAHPICNEGSSSIEGGPDTPACHGESKYRITRSTDDNLDRDLLDTIDLLDVLRSCSVVDQLWRENKRPLHRTAKRRIML